VLELRLVKDNEVILTLPINRAVEDGEQFQSELAIEHASRMAELYSMASNERKLRMIHELVRRREMRFSDFLEMRVNPKLVQDCLGPLVDKGMVVHEKRGSLYRPSESGVAFAITMTTVVEGLMSALARAFEEAAQEEEQLE
jgi:hypothetical protein